MIRKAIVVAALLVAAPAVAQFTGPTTNNRAQASTVAQVANARPGSYVILTGNVIAREREDYFTFRDATGTIRVEIEDDVFAGRKVGPETNVRITGEVETSFRGRYIDADSLEILP